MENGAAFISIHFSFVNLGNWGGMVLKIVRILFYIIFRLYVCVYDRLYYLFIFLSNYQMIIAA